MQPCFRVVEKDEVALNIKLFARGTRRAACPETLQEVEDFVEAMQVSTRIDLLLRLICFHPCFPAYGKQTRAKRRSSHSRPVRPDRHEPIHLDCPEVFFVALKISFPKIQSPNAANQTPQTPAQFQNPRPSRRSARSTTFAPCRERGRRGKRSTTKRSHASRQPRGVVPGVWILPRAVDATEPEVVDEHHSPRSTVHVEECRGPVPNERDEGLQTLNEIGSVTNSTRLATDAIIGAYAS
ncbi:uncharacterized protein CCOS01_03601 [Colletotrichum costaricense]|uniref:Uncharacterized protein n=1 Tax=Colletotrichum costaricense TaxID=1209916 RepID=A0AAJ0E5W8_9PEZI|nr:uncharacterized protein CCOS01_03601 [Colletotrichum costaricense]KAK1534849.1 hypothetical protein CCOS01_03601 [Colletotrichum costaricense]